MKIIHIVWYEERKTPIDFRDIRSKVKVAVTENRLKFSEIFGFRMITQKVYI